MLDCHTFNMKTSSLIALATLCALAAPGKDAQNLSFDINVGTQGAGVSIGYKLNPGVRLRLRGAVLGYSANEDWGDSDARLKIYGNNVGLLVDIFPGEGNFYISAGLNFSESKMRCRSRIYREPGMAANAIVGGTEYSVTDGDYADINGKYSWNHAQPYIGIGYQNYLFKGTSLYYSVDFGINFMGSGKLSTSSTGNLLYRDSTTGTMKPATEEVMEKSIRKEGRDFFKIADDLCVYPVLQFAIGARF